MPPDPLRHRQHPLTVRHPRQHVVNHVGGRLDHPAGGAGWADVATLATERDQEIMAAVGTIDAGKPVGQDTALQILAIGGLSRAENTAEIVILNIHLCYTGPIVTATGTRRTE